MVQFSISNRGADSSWCTPDAVSPCRIIPSFDLLGVSYEATKFERRISSSFGLSLMLSLMLIDGRKEQYRRLYVASRVIGNLASCCTPVNALQQGWSHPVLPGLS